MSVHNFGKNLKKYREASGLSMAELGRLVGTDRSTICRYESGVRTPRYDMMQAIAKALKVKTGDLV